jgi:CheY-like chemotaxis protein
MRTEPKPFEILLAEDNLADVALVREALRTHEVDCVLHVIRDGAQVIHWLDNLDSDPTSDSLDLLLLDMHLPKFDGQDILKRLRSTERYAQTPVVVMTALDSRLVGDQAVGHAALVYFRKPSTLSEFMRLGSIVRQVLAGDKGRAGGVS